MNQAWRNLPRPVGRPGARPVTVAEEAQAIAAVSCGVGQSNKRHSVLPRRAGSLPNTLNRLSRGGRDWSDEPDQAPLTVAAILRKKGGWRPYGAYSVRPTATHYVRPSARIQSWAYAVAIGLALLVALLVIH